MTEINVTKWDENGKIKSQKTIKGDFGKSVYSNTDFMNKIPANKFKLIRTSENDDIEKWFDLVKMSPVVDLNILPAWFTDGLDAMVTEMIFTQDQIDSFLEK